MFRVLSHVLKGPGALAVKNMLPASLGWHFRTANSNGGTANYNYGARVVSRSGQEGTISASLSWF